MRLLVVIGRLAGGGAERVTATWLGGLLDRGHHVSALTHVAPLPAEVLPGLQRTHLDLPTKAARWTGLPRGIRARVEADSPDVVLGVLDFCNIATLAAVASLPAGRRPAVVTSEHTVMSLYLRTQGRSGLARSALARRLYQRADAAIAVSAAVGTDLVTGYGIPAERLFVLPNPLTVGTVAQPRPRAAPGSALRLVYVGRLVPEKRPGLVLATAAALCAAGHDCTVGYVGDGPLRGDLEADAVRLGVPALFHGWVDDWRGAATDANCLVLPSVVEGFGVVLVEAAQVGLPVVAPATALGVADAVVPGVTGTLALSARPGDLADAVLSAVRTPGLSASGAQGWLEEFSVRAAVDRLETVLLRAAART